MVDRPNISPVELSKHVFLLVFSHPGRGKTTLIGTSPKPARTLIIRPPHDKTDSIAGTGVRETVVDTWSKFTDTTAWLRMEGYKEFDWVWLDSLSIWQMAGLDDIWRDVVQRRPDRRMWGLDKGEYGVNMERIGQHIRDLVALDEFNMGITAHAALMDDPVGRTTLMPYIQGKNMADQICGYMNVVAYLDVIDRDGEDRHQREPRRVLHTRASEDWYAKCQFPNAFPSGRLLDPTMAKITAAIDQVRSNTVPQKTRVRGRTIKRRT